MPSNKSKSKQNRTKKTMTPPPSSTAFRFNTETADALERLSKSILDLDSVGNHNNEILSHWRDLPEDVSVAYAAMDDGANAIKAAATKYTLIGKLCPDDGSKIAEDLRKGSELIATGVIVLHSPSPVIGCSHSTRIHTKRRALSVLTATLSLIRSFLDESALGKNVGAQKTGAVWECCDLLLKVPRGNRSSIRRDLLMWTKDCNETLIEFQEMLDLGVKDEEEEEEEDDDNEEDDWEDFLQGNSGDQYSTLEYAIAEPALAIIKCSRGSLSVTLKACECAGLALRQSPDDLSEEHKTQIYKWIATICQMCRTVANDVTDLGVLLYPPLDLNNLSPESGLEGMMKKQHDGVVGVVDFIMNANDEGTIKMSVEVMELASKIRTAVEARFEQGVASIGVARENR